MRTIPAILLGLVLAVAPLNAVRAQYVMDVLSLVAALQIGDLNGAVEGVTAANRVYVARVTELSGIKQNGERLTRVVAQRRGVLRYFRYAIRGAPEAMKALEVHGESLDDVIYATYTNDLTATLYVDNR